MPSRPPLSPLSINVATLSCPLPHQSIAQSITHQHWNPSPINIETRHPSTIAELSVAMPSRSSPSCPPLSPSPINVAMPSRPLPCCLSHSPSPIKECRCRAEPSTPQSFFHQRRNGSPLPSCLSHRPLRNAKQPLAELSAMLSITQKGMLSSPSPSRPMHSPLPIKNSQTIRRNAELRNPLPINNHHPPLSPLPINIATPSSPSPCRLKHSPLPIKECQTAHRQADHCQAVHHTVLFQSMLQRQPITKPSVALPIRKGRSANCQAICRAVYRVPQPSHCQAVCCAVRCP